VIFQDLTPKRKEMFKRFIAILLVFILLAWNVPPSPSAPPPSQPEEEAPAKTRATNAVFIAAGLITGGLLLFWFLHRGEGKAKELEKAQPKLKVAVFPLEEANSEAIEEDLGGKVAEMVSTALGMTGRFTALERSEIDKISQEKALPLKGAMDEVAAQKAGKLLGVELVMIGNVAKFGKLTEVNIRLIRTSTGEIVLKDYVASSSLEELKEAIDGLAEKVAEKYR